MVAISASIRGVRVSLDKQHVDQCISDMVPLYVSLEWQGVGIDIERVCVEKWKGKTLLKNSTARLTPVIQTPLNPFTLPTGLKTRLL